ncbi:MAG: hypothetical protein ACLSHC_04600 [Bilophila wadsworthia]
MIPGFALAEAALALACDIRIASEKAASASPVGLGIWPDSAAPSACPVWWAGARPPAAFSAT